jgi:hypothetical protein
LAADLRAGEGLGAVTVASASAVGQAFEVTVSGPGATSAFLATLRRDGPGTAFPGLTTLGTRVTLAAPGTNAAVISTVIVDLDSASSETAAGAANAAGSEASGAMEAVAATVSHSVPNDGGAALWFEVYQGDPAHIPLGGAAAMEADNGASPAELVVADEALSPEGCGLLGDGGADLSAIERALQLFLDRLAAMPGEFSSWFTRLGPLPWVLMGLAAAGAGQELVRRRKQKRRQGGGPEGDDAVGLRWASGLV